MSSQATVPEVGTARSKTGYIGSLIVHLGVIGAAVICAQLARRDAVEVEDHDPLLLEVWQGDGSNRAPGIPGREHGIADGSSTGDKSKVGRGGFARIRQISADKLLKEMRDNEARAAAEAKAEAAKAAQETKVEKASPDKSDKPSSKEKWSPDYLKNGKTSSKSSHGKSTSADKSSGGSTGSHSIKGSTVGGSGTGTGKGTGADGFGRNGGKGKNGGEGGSGDAIKLFVGDVKGKLADIYIPMFREQGVELGSSRDKGKVRVVVSASGLVSFGGWVRKPSDPLLERIVFEAIAKMGPVRPPPSGEEAAVSFEVTGGLDE